MKPIFAIAIHTLREALRAQVLYVIAVSGLLLTGGALLLAPIALGQVDRIVLDLGLTGMSLAGLLVLTLLGTTLLAREMERRTTDVLLSKPIRRLDYMLGKYLGFLMALTLLVAAETGFLFLALKMASPGDVTWRPLLGAGMTLAELAVEAALLLFFASFAGPLVGAFFLISAYVVGHLAPDLIELAGRAQLPILKWIYFAVPNLASLDVRPEVVHGVAIDPSRIALALAHAASYSAASLALAVLVFSRRELR
jgi:ABC-type transport system involved in multi-copper enzyme maturation permease subunit